MNANHTPESVAHCTPRGGLRLRLRRPYRAYRVCRAMVWGLIFGSCMVTAAPARAQMAVIDTAAIAAINSLSANITTQFSRLFTLYLTPLNTNVSLLVAQGIVNPAMAAAITQATTSAGTALASWVAQTQPATGTPDVLGLPLALTANVADPRFYTTQVLGGPSSCISDASAVGAALTTKCIELQNLRTFRALHASAYQMTLSAGMLTAFTTLAAAVPLNIADVQAKDMAMNTLNAMQKAMGELYQSQQDYLQARIEVVAEVRQALANKKSGKSNPGGLLNAAWGTAAKLIFAAARATVP